MTHDRFKRSLLSRYINITTLVEMARFEKGKNSKPDLRSERKKRSIYSGNHFKVFNFKVSKWNWNDDLSPRTLTITLLTPLFCHCLSFEVKYSSCRALSPSAHVRSIMVSSSPITIPCLQENRLLCITRRGWITNDCSLDYYPWLLIYYPSNCLRKFDAVTWAFADPEKCCTHRWSLFSNIRCN